MQKLAVKSIQSFRLTYFVWPENSVFPKLKIFPSRKGKTVKNLVGNAIYSQMRFATSAGLHG